MIGIITFHRAINYGAVLQTYALQTAVQALGESCEVINYVGDKMFKESKFTFIPRDASMLTKMLYVYRLKMNLKTASKFDCFRNEYLNLSGKLIKNDKELIELGYRYERIITGSDQVFNYIGTDEDFNYYLEFVKENHKKIAYAPSFGLKKIDLEHTNRVQRDLGSFSKLSAREEQGAKIIEGLLEKKVPKVCDPTFLLSKEQWEKISIDPKYKKPYVLVYAFGSRHLDNIAKELAKDINGCVISINRWLPILADFRDIKNAKSPSPTEFLGLIKNAEVVVTNSFHGAALSILLEKEVYIFKNSYSNSENTNIRFLTLCNDFDIQDRLFDSVSDFVKKKTLNYNSIICKKKLLRDQGIAYLEKAIHD